MKLIGRERELDRAAQFLERARTERVARILRITGNSGNGKTALSREIQQRAADNGWLAVYLASHRIQSALPMVVARRAAEEIVRALGGGGPKYASGLEAALLSSETEPKTFESALMRLIEGVLHDRPLLLVVDDVQWSDPESRSVLPNVVRTFADRTLALVLSERIDETTDMAIELADETIVINEMGGDDAYRLAADLMPGASQRVITAVVDHARGRPVDIATIASLSSDFASLTVDDVAESARSIVARDVAALPAPVREFLQICSLICDPLDYELLSMLWPDERTLLEFIKTTSGRYITQDHELRFVHATVAQSILETIPIEIPYRKRIISAIESMRSITPARYEMLVDQAAGCGDRALEFKYLTELSREALKRGSTSLMANALERAIPLAPDDADLLRMYTDVAGAYNGLGRDDGARIAREGLERAAAAGIRKGTGPLVAALLFSLFINGDRRDFENALAQYEPQLTEPSDRAHMLSMLLYKAYNENDEAAFAAYNGQLRSTGGATHVHEVRFEAFNAIMRARAGHFEDAQSGLNAARAIIEGHSLFPLAVMVTSAEALLAFYVRGVGTNELRRTLQLLEKHDVIRAGFEVMELFATGSAADAIERAVETYQQSGAFGRRVLLGLAGSVAALSQATLPEYVWRDLIREAHAGGDFQSLAPVLSAAAALSKDSAEAARLSRRALEIATKPLENQVMWTPVVLAKGAMNGKATDVLAALASSLEPHDAYPWTQAHHRLARLTALRALKQPVDGDEAASLSSAFLELGAPYLADLVLALGAKSELPQADVPSVLSRREREVAHLVAQGKSNREIAETLVLSERTVEGHIANIFAKLNVGSRAQIATWYVTLGA